METAVKLKMLIFVLLTEKRLAVSVWTLLKYLCYHSDLEKTETPKIFVVAEVFF